MVPLKQKVEVSAQLLTDLSVANLSGQGSLSNCNSCLDQHEWKLQCIPRGATLKYKDLEGTTGIECSGQISNQEHQL